jgi:exodeoxyribonuclease V gamma subunit
VYLASEGQEDNPEKWKKQAKTEYEGDVYNNRVGEVRQEAALARAWPSWEQLLAAGFEHYAYGLYHLCYTALSNAPCYPLDD